MPVKLSTYSNFSVTVARVYYEAMSNRNLFALLDMAAFVLKERSNVKVTVAVEAFDGEHRGRLQGGGQYYAHQDAEANELVRPFMPGSDKPSALTKAGKALWVKVLAAHVIKLLLNGPPTMPRIPGVYVPPLARAAQRRWLLQHSAPRPAASHRTNRTNPRGTHRGHEAHQPRKDFNRAVHCYIEMFTSW